MAEKQNYSEIKVSSSTARRRAILPTLSRILKNQTSSFQHRASPTIKPRTSGGIKMFLFKGIIGCGAIYLSTILGVWGEAEESAKVMSKIKTAITHISNEKLISENVAADFMDKINKSRDFLKGQLEGIPEELKACYDKSEQYIKDLIKGKKS